MNKQNEPKSLKIRRRGHSEETIFEARYLYLRGAPPAEIARELGLNSPRAVYYWAEKYNWRALLDENGVEELMTMRILSLMARENKSDGEIKELESLIALDVQYKANRAKYAQKAKQRENSAARAQSDENAQSGEMKPQKRGKPPKNAVDHLTAEDFAPFLETLFDYQQRMRANKDKKTRLLLKSRQIGATYYFAFEALEDAVLTGDNQIFLSASKAQSQIFRTYIIKMARQFLGVELSGNPIILSNGAELHFLSTNKSTAQGYHGHVYGDEFAWVRDFEEFQKVSSAMATHKKWRLTYFSTPSSRFHASYSFWSGDQWRGNNRARQKVLFPAEAEMKDGVMCPDGVWRYVVDIDDAVKGGAGELFDVEELKTRYSPAAYEQLFKCKWIDDTESIFDIAKLLKCSVDITKWRDIDFGAAQPLGAREVWCGYDPAHSVDGASFVVIAPPSATSEKYRLIDRHTWIGQSYKWQAARIEEISKKYNVTYIGIDTNGVGRGVFEMVQDFAKSKAKAILYDSATKTEMVLKVQDLVDCGNLEWSDKESDIISSFLMIKQVTTKSGNGITYTADRNLHNRHADVFWAICHAINKKELNDNRKRRSRWAIHR